MLKKIMKLLGWGANQDPQSTEQTSQNLDEQIELKRIGLKARLYHNRNPHHGRAQFKPGRLTMNRFWPQKPEDGISRDLPDYIPEADGIPYQEHALPEGAREKMEERRLSENEAFYVETLKRASEAAEKYAKENFKGMQTGIEVIEISDDKMTAEAHWFDLDSARGESHFSEPKKQVFKV